MLKSRRALLSVLLILTIIVVDQLIKFEIKTNFSLYESVRITDRFQILFTENRGMAFGMALFGTAFLAGFRLIAIGFFGYVLCRFVRREAPMGLIVCLSMVIAGALGNLIDNAFYGLIFTESQPYLEPARLVGFGEGYGSFMSGRVVDMFYFPLFTWPDWMPFLAGRTFFGAIFNFADASISCGAVALIIFYYKRLTREGLFKA